MASKDTWPTDVPAILRRRADVALVFDDGTTLPANKEVLCIHSSVLGGLLGDSDVAMEPGPDGAARLQLPGEARGVWLTALRIMYAAPKLSPDDVAPLLPLAHKFDIRAVTQACGNYIVGVSDETLTTYGRGGYRVWQWMPLAAQYGLDAAVKRMMDTVHARKIHLQLGVELGAAAEPLARYFINANANCTRK